MTLLGFVVDLPRLSARVIEDVKKMLLEVGEKYRCSSFLRSLDMIALFKITDTEKGIRLAVEYRAENPGYFRGDDFTEAVKKLEKEPLPVGLGLGPELSSRDVVRLLHSKQYYDVGMVTIAKKIIIITSKLPNLDSSESLFMVAKKRGISFEFLLVDHGSISIEKIENFERTIAKFENCGMKYFPASDNMEMFAKGLSNELNDDSCDMISMLLDLGPTAYTENVAQEFRSAFINGSHVEVVTVYRIISPLVQSRLDSFRGTDDPYLSFKLFFPANMDEVYSVLMNGLDPFVEHKGRFQWGDLKELFGDSPKVNWVEGQSIFLGCNEYYIFKEDEESKLHVSPAFLIVCKLGSYLPLS